MDEGVIYLEFNPYSCPGVNEIYTLAYYVHNIVWISAFLAHSFALNAKRHRKSKEPKRKLKDRIDFTQGLISHFLPSDRVLLQFFSLMGKHDCLRMSG